MTRKTWKAYYRGWRTGRRIKRYAYYYNPYPHQSNEWYAFNSGWENQSIGFL